MDIKNTQDNSKLTKFEILFLIALVGYGIMSISDVYAGTQLINTHTANLMTTVLLGMLGWRITQKRLGNIKPIADEKN
ncbi:hypothetical protein GR140_19015 [Pseudomonas putida]|uniref:hypothetical protein n=1 Tax=Pseudomonas putida TaxID=303 RepID=UPI001BAF61BD|nr:hypothetical protein [Pseudomonas putida]QUG90757.1 hypothetical protein GR140_19015 [Pseudomonas putida]